VIILDVNILIYAVNRDAKLHSRAKSWLEAALSGTETIGIPWIVILAFLRLTTRAGLFRNPMPMDAAFDVLESWLEQPPVIIVDPGPRHRTILRGLLAAIGSGGNLTSDAHLAALALENRAELCSFDQDFLRFPDLKWRNPLA
jgi:toxin-antitoxin system PIN domain toxin